MKYFKIATAALVCSFLIGKASWDARHASDRQPATNQGSSSSPLVDGYESCYRALETGARIQNSEYWLTFENQQIYGVRCVDQDNVANADTSEHHFNFIFLTPNGVKRLNFPSQVSVIFPGQPKKQEHVTLPRNLLEFESNGLRYYIGAGIGRDFSIYTDATAPGYAQRSLDTTFESIQRSSILPYREMLVKMGLPEVVSLQPEAESGTNLDFMNACLGSRVSDLVGAVMDNYAGVPNGGNEVKDIKTYGSLVDDYNQKIHNIAPITQFIADHKSLYGTPSNQLASKFYSRFIRDYPACSEYVNLLQFAGAFNNKFFENQYAQPVKENYDTLNEIVNGH